jgi:hypothetical protein
MRTIATLPFLALVGTLAAARAGAAEPCSLLTADEVSQILGIQALPGRPWMGTSKTSCFYSAASGFELTSRSVTVQVITRAAFDFGKQMSTRGPLAGKGAGVGDESYFVAMGSYAKLGVRKGDRAFSITVTPGPTKVTPDQLGELERQLAAKAAARL